MIFMTYTDIDTPKSQPYSMSFSQSCKQILKSKYLILVATQNYSTRYDMKPARG